jgi:hypothetical protein
MFFTAEELCTTIALVSKSWFELQNSNWLWENLCEKLWSDKVYIPKKFINMKPNAAKLAYIGSLHDSKRGYVTVDELCSFEWQFRFKEAAGSAWTENDPYWQGKPPSVTHFFPDGTMKRDTIVRAPDFKFTWRFVDSSSGKKGEPGSFIRINNFPTYCVSRVQRNWGFIMQSCWALSASFPLPPLNCTDNDLDDAHLDVTTETQQAEAFAYNTGLDALLDRFDGVDVEQLVRLLMIARARGQQIVLVEDEDAEMQEREVDETEMPQDDLIVRDEL